LAISTTAVWLAEKPTLVSEELATTLVCISLPQATKHNKNKQHSKRQGKNSLAKRK
jgi:hypothetical protein